MATSANFQTVFIFLYFSFFFSGSDGLKDVRIEGLISVRKGDDARLTCNYNLENEGLYALKWYRGSEEFYRFVPKEVPPKKVFQQHGIHVEEETSDEHSVFLKNVSLDTSGKFKCSVCVENTFQTLEATTNLQVVGYDAPKLIMDKQNYYPGEKGIANCSIERSSHPTHIQWFLNNAEVTNLSRTFTIKDPSSEFNLYTTISTLPFTLPENFTPLNLRCKGKLFDVYGESSILTIQSQPKPSASQSKTLSRSVGTNAKGIAQGFHRRGGGGGLGEKLYLISFCLFILSQSIFGLTLSTTTTKTTYVKS